MSYNYYVCDTNPNGTNDLLVTTEGSTEIIDVLPEACFGLDVIEVDREYQLGVHIYTNHVILLDKSFLLNDPLNLNGLSYLVKGFNLAEIMRNRACSPVDPDGDRLIKFIANYFI